MSKLYSKDLERACIAGCLQYPQNIADIAPFIDPPDFYFEGNGAIFSCIKSFFNDKKSIDSVLLAERLVSIGLTSIHDIPVGDYVHAIAKSDRISEGSFMDRFKELKKFSVLRDIDKMAKEIAQIAAQGGSLNLQEVVSKVEQKFSESINIFDPEQTTVNVFETLADFIEERGNNPDDGGIKAPYRFFRKLYGDFLEGGLYVFCAPPKSGKSTFLMDIADKTTLDDNVYALYLDTELTTEEFMLREASKLSGVKEFYLRNGSWRREPAMEQKVREALAKVEKRHKNIEHFYVANKPIDEIISVVRRWHFNKALKDKRLVIFYDYLKLTGENISDAWKEHQVMGNKATKLKDLAQELKCPIVSAVQTNASGTIAMSNQIKWFVNMLGMLRPKLPEEIAEDGIEFGTHTLEVTESRNQGENGMGFIDLVKLPNGDFKRINIHFKFENFHVTEICTLRELAKSHDAKIQL